VILPKDRDPRFITIVAELRRPRSWAGLLQSRERLAKVIEAPSTSTWPIDETETLTHEGAIAVSLPAGSRVAAL
jgi:hypothetical protein